MESHDLLRLAALKELIIEAQGRILNTIYTAAEIAGDYPDLLRMVGVLESMELTLEDQQSEIKELEKRIRRELQE